MGKYTKLILGSFALVATINANDSCTKGHYFDSHSNACQTCPKGSHASQDGGKSILDCLPCAPGYYADQEGSTECTISPPGYHADDNGEAHYACPRGTFLGTSGGKSVLDCQGCAPGYFSGQIGATECKVVPAGYHADDNGEVYYACPKGTYLDHEGGKTIMDCKHCSHGSFSNTTGSTHCTAVPAGHYPFRGDTYYSCPRGTFNHAEGALNITACQPCPVGTYAYNEGSVECKTVPTGHYPFRAETIYACPKGTYLEHEGGQSIMDCKHCSPGTFSNATGSTQCEVVPANHYAFRQETLIGCPAGTTSVAGAKSIDDCHHPSSF